MTILRKETFDTNALIFVLNDVRVVYATAISAGCLGLLNLNLDVIGNTEMDERVHATSVLLEHLGLGDAAREVSENETFACLVGHSENFESDTILGKLVDVTGVEHLLHLDVERVRVFFLNASKLLNVSKYVGHRDDGQAEVNTEASDQLVLERVGRREEHDLGGLRPSLNELLLRV